jgi:hypothetical protein
MFSFIEGTKAQSVLFGFGGVDFQRAAQSAVSDLETMSSEL